MSAKRIGFGIVGLGGISGAHVDGLLKATEHARLVAVCDLDRERAARVAAEVGARLYVDYVDLLNDPEVDAVDLPLPHNLHFRVAKHALEAGKHVIVEKPMAPTVAECAALIELAADRGLKLSVSENTRFVLAYLEVERLLRSGALGQPRLIRTLISGTEVRRLADPANWKGREAGATGGAIFDAGPHSFYLLKWLLGEVKNVRAIARRLVAASQVEDNAVVAGVLKCGAVFTSEFTFTAEIPWGERLEIYGSEGSVIVDQLLNPPAVHFRGATDSAGQPLAKVLYMPDRVEHDPEGWKFRSISDGISAFAAAVCRDELPPVDPRDGLYAMKIVERAYASIKADGQEIAI